MLYIKILELSINPIIVVFPKYSIGRSIDIKNRNRISNRVNPYRMPIFYSFRLSIKLLSLRHIVLSYRKD